MTLADEVLQLLVLFLGQAFGFDRVDADGLANARRDGESVAGEDGHTSHAKFAQLRNDFACVATQLVFQTNRTEVAAALHDVHARHAFDLRFNCAHFSGHCGVQLNDPRATTCENLARRGGRRNATSVHFAIGHERLWRDARAFCSLEDRLRERVIRRLLRIGRGLQQRRAIDALCGSETADRELARRQRAGLVHHDRVDVGRCFERAGLLDHHAEPRCSGERGDHCGWVRNEKGARARHDEHGDRALRGFRLRVGRARLRDEEPHDARDHQNDGDVVTRDAFDELLLAALCALRFADEFLNLADRRFALDGGDFDFDLSGEVCGTCVDGRSGLNFNWHRFACQRGLVDAGSSSANVAVGGEIFARSHTNDRAALQLRERNLALHAVLVDEARDIRSEFDQFANCTLCPPRGAREHEFGEPEEEGEEARREVHLIRDRCEDREACKAVARRAALAEFFESAARKRHREHERADERGDAAH